MITMGLSGVVVSVLALASAVWATVGDNSLEGERVVFVAPVLAPPKDNRKYATDRSRQFPVLVLLAQQNQNQNAREHEAKSLNSDPHPQPIYVQVSFLVQFWINCELELAM